MTLPQMIPMGLEFLVAVQHLQGGQLPSWLKVNANDDQHMLPQQLPQHIVTCWQSLMLHASFFGDAASCMLALSKRMLLRQRPEV